MNPVLGFPVPRELAVGQAKSDPQISIVQSRILSNDCNALNSDNLVIVVVSVKLGSRVTEAHAVNSVGERRFVNSGYSIRFLGCPIPTMPFMWSTK